MKKIITLSILILLVSCAKKGPDFVPLTLNWFAYSGDIFAFGKEVAIEPVDEPFSTKCIIAMTQALMEAPTIQAHAEDGMAFNVQYFGYHRYGETNIQFRGSCQYSDNNIDFEKKPMILDPKPVREGCSWSARCTDSGKIKDLEFLGSIGKIQRKKHLGQ
ncbi:MAG: hypothetical protein WCX75_03260 [Fibrobacteraceae bacterium]